MSASLVGSEMCIRDRSTRPEAVEPPESEEQLPTRKQLERLHPAAWHAMDCLLYTSDAADDM
eukprot:3172169-Alexandrium_andersonii.AAC.1